MRTYLSSSEAATADAALSTLLCAHATPLIERVFRSKRLRADEDVDDLVQGALLRLVARLRACRSAAGGMAGIQEFESYVAATAHHVFAEHLRSKNPEHRRLRRRLLNALRRDDRFRLVRDDQGRWLCALTAPSCRPSSGSQREHAGDVHAALSALARPVRLDAVVTALCDSGASSPKPPAAAPPPWPSPESRTSDRQFLHGLWAEIGQLPIAQRQALLLNLSDPQGRDLIALLPLTGTASMRDIARSLEMPPEELAGLWSRLPLDDATIGGRLGLCRQQVVNLRTAARRRLLRRLGAPR